MPAFNSWTGVDNPTLDGQYVSATSADTAAGVITFTAMPKVQSAAAAPITGKALGSGSVSPFEIVHDDTQAYIFHLTAGENMGSSAAFIGLGVEYGGDGLVARNYGDGGTGAATTCINFQNLSTVTAATASGLLGIQSSTAAPLVRLRTPVAGAAPLLQLQTDQAMSAGTYLARFYLNSVEQGHIKADTGVMQWYEDIVVKARSAGLRPQLRVEDEAAQPTRVYLQADTDAPTGTIVYRWSGSAALYYGFQMIAESDRFKINASEGPAAVGAETYNTMIEVRSNAGSGSFGQMGFFGVTPANRPTAYTQTYSTADKTHANPTAAAVVTTASTLAAYGYTQAQADAIVTAVNALRADHLDLAQLVNSVIDDLQALGLVQ